MSTAQFLIGLLGFLFPNFGFGFWGFFFVCFLDIELYEFFIYFGYQPLIRGISFANIFSHSVGCLLILLSFLCCAEAFQFDVALLVYFLLLFPLLLESDSKKLSSKPMSRSLLPMFSSRDFTVLGLSFKSLIHFQLIFVYGVRQQSGFILLHVAVQFSQNHFLNKLSYFHHIFLAPSS